MEAVVLRGLRKVYAAGTVALDGLDLTVPEGEVFGLVGPDGAGKTTLMKCLAAILSPTAGEARVLGYDLDRAPEEVRHRIGYIAQRFSVYGDLTVDENVDFYAALFPPHPERKQLKADLLERIGLASFSDRLAADLSGGMRQKLALLCCLIHQPALLLLDEPTVGVDPVSRREFWRIVFGLQGVTVVAATPYMDEAEQFDRLALLSGGRFLRVGTAAQLKAAMAGRVLEVLCSRPFDSGRLLRGLGGVQDVQLFGDRLHVVVPSDWREAEEQVRRALVEAEVEVRRLREVPPSVEDVFLQLSSSEVA